MAALVLKAFSLGVEKLPDKAFEALPGGYFKAKEKDRRDKEQRDYERKRDGKRDRRGDKSNRRRYNSVPPSRVDYDDYAGHESDDLNARSSRRRHRTDYARDSSPDYDRGRRHNTKGYGAAPSNMDSYAVPRPYNPAEYGRPPTAAPVPSYPSAYPTQGYHQAYQSHPQEPSSAARRYSPPSSYTPSPVNQPAYQPPSNPPYSSTYVPPSAVPSATKTTYPNEAYASYRRYDDGYDTSRRRGSGTSSPSRHDKTHFANTFDNSPNGPADVLTGDRASNDTGRGNFSTLAGAVRGYGAGATNKPSHDQKQSGQGRWEDYDNY